MVFKYQRAESFPRALELNTGISTLSEKATAATSGGRKARSLMQEVRPAAEVRLDEEIWTSRNSIGGDLRRGVSTESICSVGITERLAYR